MMQRTPRKDFGAAKVVGRDEPLLDEFGNPREISLRFKRPGELFGVIQQMYGGSRMLVLCEDSRERVCRIPGKIRRRLWMKEGDIVLVMPWAVQGEEKGDIVYRYTKMQVDKLREKKLIRF